MANNKRTFGGSLFDDNSEEAVEPKIEEKIVKEEEKPQPKIAQSNQKKKYKVILVAPNYIVVDVRGSGQYVNKGYGKVKVGDEIELTL